MMEHSGTGSLWRFTSYKYLSSPNLLSIFLVCYVCYCYVERTREIVQRLVKIFKNWNRKAWNKDKSCGKYSMCGNSSTRYTVRHCLKYLFLHDGEVLQEDNTMQRPILRQR